MPKQTFGIALDLRYLCTMNDFQFFLRALNMLVPVFTAFACIVLTGFSRRDSLNPEEKRLKGIFMAYLFLIFTVWFATFCYYFAPELFVYLNTACLAGFVLVPVFLYRLIRFLIRMEQTENFSFFHYIVPAALILLMLVWSFFVPAGYQLALVKSHKFALAGEYEAYSRFFTSKPFLRLIFVVVYYSFIGVELMRYYRRANRLNLPSRRPARWMIFLIALTVMIGFNSLFAIMPKKVAFANMWMASLTITGQFVLLTYHIIRHKYRYYTAYPAAMSRQKDTGSPKRRTY